MRWDAPRRETIRRMYGWGYMSVWSVLEGFVNHTCLLQAFQGDGFVNDISFCFKKQDIRRSHVMGKEWIC